MSKKVCTFAVANRPIVRSERKCIKANSDNVNLDNSLVFVGIEDWHSIGCIVYIRDMAQVE